MFHAVYETLLELSPWFLLGMGFSGMMHVLLPRDFVRRQLTGSWGVAKAVMLGVPMPLCSCGVIPAGLGLKRDGASDGASLGFLISTPQTGVDSILVSASFLGWPFALFKVLAAAITGTIGGWLADRIPENEDVPRDLGTKTPEHDQRDLRAMLQHAHDLLASIWRWLVFGIVVSALIDTFVPVGTLGGLAGLGSLGAGLAVLTISLPLYVCATASVPIAAAMVANGMPVGAALVFLMAGPATNIATIGAIFRGFGTRPLAVYLGVLIFGSVGFGVLFDFAINPGTLDHTTHSGPHDAWWAVASAIVLVAMIVRLALHDLIGLVRKRSGRGHDGELEVSVEGMTCGACIRKVEAVLSEVDGVTSAVVTRNPDRALVRGHADRSQIDAAIASAGYRVRPT